MPARAAVRHAAVPQLADETVAQKVFALDLLVAASNVADSAPAASLARLQANGMLVARKPRGLTPAAGAALWHSANQVSEPVKRGALALFVRTDVVTTEAHALVLSMVGPPPAFAVQPALSGLDARQQQFASAAPLLSRLLSAAWQEGHGAALWATVRASAGPLQPTAATLARYDRTLTGTFGPAGAGVPTAHILVAPLMAEDTGATLMLGSDEAILLLGPTKSTQQRDTLALHEMLHPRIAALLQASPALQRAIAESSCLRGTLEAAAGDVSVSQVYDGWSDYVTESWVRGLSHVLAHTPQEEDGFVLAPAFAALSRGSIAPQELAARAVALLHAQRAHYCARTAAPRFAHRHHHA